MSFKPRPETREEWVAVTEAIKRETARKGAILNEHGVLPRKRQFEIVDEVLSERRPREVKVEVAPPRKETVAVEVLPASTSLDQLVLI